MNLEADFLWIPKLLLFPSLSISSFVQTPSGTWKRWTFCWKAHCLGTYFQCLIHSNLCNLNWIFPVIWVEDFFLCYGFCFSWLCLGVKKATRSRCFCCTPSFCGHRCDRRGCWGGGSCSPTDILHPGSPEQHQLGRFCVFSLSILFCPTVEVIMFWNVTLELGQIISTTSVFCNGLDDEGAYIADIILLSQAEDGLLMKQWNFDMNWCKLLSTGCGKTPGCYQQWTKTSAKHGSSHIPITFVCSSKFCTLFSVVINLMLFKSLVVTSSLQPLKIMRFNFRKQKGTICVQVNLSSKQMKTEPDSLSESFRNFTCRVYRKHLSDMILEIANIWNQLV